MTQIATSSRWGKVLIFKPKALSVYTAWCSYINFFPKNIDQNLGFWAGQRLTLSRNTCFCGFNSSLVVKSHMSQPERLAISKMWTTCLSTCPYDNNFWPISLGNLTIILGAWNGFLVDFQESCDQRFFLNYNFWKYLFRSPDWGA